MPCNPKIIEPDELPPAFTGEQELPPHLAALAQRLEADAQQLAVVYPSGRAPAPLPNQPRPLVGSAFGAGIGAAALVIAAGMVASRTTPTIHQPATAGRPVLTAAAITTSRSSSPSSAPGSGIPPSAPLLASAVAAISVAELSGPELEALVDLVGGEAEAAASVSF